MLFFKMTFIQKGKLLRDMLLCYISCIVWQLTQGLLLVGCFAPTVPDNFFIQKVM